MAITRPTAEVVPPNSACSSCSQGVDEASRAKVGGQNLRSENGSPNAIPKGEGHMTFWRWLYRRIGQIGCFAAAPVLLLLSSSAYEPLPPVFGSAILFAVGLTLRQQMIKRFYVR